MRLEIVRCLVHRGKRLGERQILGPARNAPVVGLEFGSHRSSRHLSRRKWESRGLAKRQARQVLEETYPLLRVFQSTLLLKGVASCSEAMVGAVSWRRWYRG